MGPNDSDNAQKDADVVDTATQDVAGGPIPNDHGHEDEVVELDLDTQRQSDDAVANTDSEEAAIGTIQLDIEEPDVAPAKADEEPAVMPAVVSNIIDDEEGEELLEQFEAEQRDAEAILVEDLIAHENINMQDLPFKVLPPNLPVDQYLMSLPASLEDIERIMIKYKIDFNIDGEEDDLPDHVRRLRLAIQQSAAIYQSKHYDGIFDRGGSNWGQGLEMGENKLLRQSLVQAKEGGGSSPVASILTQLNLGTVIQIPLWHSGIWVAIKKPKESELLNLEAEIAFEKASLGRATNGAVFSNNEVYAKKAIVDFALRHVIKATTESIEPTYLANLILETDWPMLAWGLILASYPKGYRHLQPCVANPETCTHIIDAMLNIGRLAWVDRSRFTKDQVAHMKNRSLPSSVEKIRAYQSQHTLNAKSSVRINDVVELELRVPTIAESIATGIEWVQSVSDNARKVFSSRMSENAREDHKNRQATLASIRQYIQWFGSFRRLNKDETFSNKDMVEEILIAINEEGDFSKLVHNRIREFIDDSTIATIALPKWSCPKCQGEPNDEYMRHPQLIPLDIIDVFFTLLGQKIQRRLVEESSNVM